MPGSLLSPHDALSDRSDASYGSSDSRTSGKKVSFNRAVRVKQYPWPPDDENHQGSANDLQHLSLPSRRFWFKVYKTKSSENPHQEDQSQNGIAQDSAWKGEEYMESMHDTLTPIAEDDDLDYSAYGSHHSNSVKNTVSKFQGESRQHPRNENFVLYGNGTPNHYASEPPVDYTGEYCETSRPKRNNSAGINGVKTVLAKSQSKLRSSNNKNMSNDYSPHRGTMSNEDDYSTRSNTVSSVRTNGNHSSKSSVDKCAPASGNGLFPVKIPRAESPRRSLDGNPRFSMRYKTRERRSRSSDDTLEDCRWNGELGKRVDKAVSTEDLKGRDHYDEVGPAWMHRASKDKSTQCNGTLNKSRNGSLLVFGAPNLSRSKANGASIHNGQIGTRHNTTSKRNQMNNSINGDGLESSRSAEIGISRFDRGRSSSRILSSTRHCSNDFHCNGHTSDAVIRSEKQRRRDPQSAAKLHDRLESDHRTNRQPNGAFEEFPRTCHKPWNSPMPERRERIRSRDAFPSSATVGYQFGRQKTFQRFAAEDKYANATSCSTNGPFTPKLNRPGNSCTSHGINECESNKAISPISESSDSTIDWTQSGFQLRRKLDSGLGSANSDSEYIIHRRSPLLMYIPGVSHHDRPAMEEDRMSGLSCISRSEVEDDIGPLVNVSKSPIDVRRRHSMPKDGKKSWAKWKINGKI